MFALLARTPLAPVPVAPAVVPPTPCAPHALSFRLITSLDDLLGVVPRWQELLDESGLANPMCAPAWLLTWWEVYRGTRELRVGLLYDGDQLVGVAPLCRRRYRYRPGIPFRRLEFLGSDVDEDDGVCSEYLTVIARPGYEERVAKAFAELVDRNAFGRWDELVLSALDGDDPMTRLLTDALKHMRATVRSQATDAAPYAKLATDWDRYLRELPKKKRKSLNSAWRHFEEWAGADWKIVCADSPDEIAQGMRIVTDLHCQRWHAEGHGGAFGSPRFQAFHQVYAPLARQRGELLLLSMWVHGAPVAALYGYVAKGKLYFYQCGRTLTAPPQVRLGIAMVIAAMKEAMRRGLEEFDFLAGQAQYKSLFTATERPLIEIRAARNGLPELARRATRWTWNELRRWGVNRWAKAAPAATAHEEAPDAEGESTGPASRVNNA